MVVIDNFLARRKCIDFLFQFPFTEEEIEAQRNLYT
jgi:hypothetical protein